MPRALFWTSWRTVANACAHSWITRTTGIEPAAVTENTNAWSAGDVTVSADKLHDYVDKLGLPVLGYLRDTQNYIHLAARGLSVFDVSPNRVERDLEQWLGICRWLDK